ncbi:MAG TPA: bifunctional UDP-3-O-[3-hydroxymyristoyl] N-acetylglucosamine deacetylase/3-hydroxyacyl-ACP dehydratase [Gemmatimonadaceae bacterium]|nr:bifunctional UDP-3-O-[3-hydroxymyristoyl] N-acetylglucosamine deacetylase/3-hydroxyacyl-ACP dehydratase [Gemmatimonadaceae bacterium]
MTRRTIAHAVSLEGIGLHLGAACQLSFRPAKSGAGIYFCRTDLAGAPVIPALAEHAVLTERRTQLGEDPVSVHTVEHVLAAVAGAEIDDLEIALNEAEPPIMDGSSAPFTEALKRAGVVEQAGTVQYLTVRRPLTLVDGESTYEVAPAFDLELNVVIDFPHPAIGRQQGCYRVTPDGFAKDLSPARTFGFVREVEALRAKGLIQGASLDNAVVLDENGVVGGTLRWPDEFLRHKALDVVGDLALAGARVRARVTTFKPSHRGTVRLVRAMQAASAKENSVLDIEEIMKVLPHRYPFLLVDRVLEIEDGKRIVGVKNVTINEPFFQGHFPGHPIMPGVLIIEAMAQVGGMLLMGSVPDRENKVVYFTSLNNVKWRRPVKPGDQLRFELELLQVRGMMCKMSGVAKVDGQIVAEAEMGAVVRDK